VENLEDCVALTELAKSTEENEMRLKRGNNKWRNAAIASMLFKHYYGYAGDCLFCEIAGFVRESSPECENCIFKVYLKALLNKNVLCGDHKDGVEWEYYNNIDACYCQVLMNVIADNRETGGVWHPQSVKEVLLDMIKWMETGKCTPHEYFK